MIGGAGALAQDSPPGRKSPSEQLREWNLREVPDDPYLPGPGNPPETFVERSGPVLYAGFTSVHVNVDAFGANMPGDAANEPSIAIDPTDPDRIVIGWRQFDNVASNFRQAGYAHSHDGGATWTFPGVITTTSYAVITTQRVTALRTHVGASAS